MLHTFCLHNGDIRRVADPVLAPGQAGLLSGWGIFTTMLVSAGVPFAFERHWARLRRDASAIHVPMPFGAESVLEGLVRLVEVNQAPECTLRLAIVRNAGAMWAAPGQARESDLIALTADTKQWGAGARLTYCAQGRHAGSRFAGTKTLSWAHNLVCLEDAQAAGFDEVILLNERGEVAECTSANIFIVQGRRVWTPPLSSGCLPGVTRELLLTAVRVEGVTVGEKTLLPEDVDSAADVFITSTTRGVLAVTAINQRGVGSVPDVRHALQAEYSAYLKSYLGERRAAGQK